MPTIRSWPHLTHQTARVCLSDYQLRAPIDANERRHKLACERVVRRSEAYLDKFFEYERCPECQGDTPHHTLTKDMFGHNFIRCDYPLSDDGTVHRVIAAFIANLTSEGAP